MMKLLYLVYVSAASAIMTLWNMLFFQLQNPDSWIDRITGQGGALVILAIIAYIAWKMFIKEREKVDKAHSEVIELQKKRSEELERQVRTLQDKLDSK